MKNRVRDIAEIIEDLAEKDELHLLLEPYEIAAVRILKTTGNMSFYMLSPKELTEGNEIIVDYSKIKPYLLQLYVDIVLITRHVGVTDFSKMDFSGRMNNLKNIFGLKLVSLLQNTVVALLDGLEKEDSILFSSALKLLHAFIFSLLEMYSVSEDVFYDDVEEYVYFILAADAGGYEPPTSNKLKVQFKGSKSIILSVDIDRRRKRHFKGFKITINEAPTKLFHSGTPYQSFLSAAHYINEVTQFKDVRFHMDKKTKIFLNGYSIMYAKEDQLVADMLTGFYPVLVPKGVTDMEGFLDALTDKL